ncbi:MAG: hypothetical protein [Circular genetic element sp.]|nr:MAG: hypothetical protein [Circular genetic element sp.]
MGRQPPSTLQAPNVSISKTAPCMNSVDSFHGCQSAQVSTTHNWGHFTCIYHFKSRIGSEIKSYSRNKVGPIYHSTHSYPHASHK